VTSYLKNKSVLFFCVQTFGIEKKIIKGLSKRGVSVTYFDERPGNSFFVKAILRMNSGLLKRLVNSYYSKILDEVKYTHYDYLLVVRGEIVPRWFLLEIKKCSPQMTLIFYTWDSFANNPNAQEILEIFHKKFSFDDVDCLKHNLKLRPLFYESDVNEVFRSAKISYDLVFIGTLHSRRYLLFQDFILNNLSSSNARIFAYFYIQNKFVYWYKRFVLREFGYVPNEYLHYESMAYEEMLSIYSKSKSVLDINHPAQSGLTLRTLETIALKKKLVTSNENLFKYRFYRSEAFFIINEKSRDTFDEFLKQDYAFPEQYYYPLSLDGWIDSVFISCEDRSFWLN
jgi:hypothetical protein